MKKSYIKIGLSALDFSLLSVYNISMKKLFLSSLSICLFFNSGTVFAQGAKVVRSASQVGKTARSAQSFSRSINTSVTNASRAGRSAAAQATSAVGKVSKVGNVSTKIGASSAATSFGRPAISTSPYVHSLAQRLKTLEFENWQLKETLKQYTERPPLTRATFLATEDPNIETNAFSGTVFKTVYNGEEEIFGVVAAHAIATSAAELALKRNFTMLFFDGENMMEVPAEIVQLSSPSMLDVALVKFSPEAEAMFQPLRISEVPVQVGDVLASQGFAGDIDVNIPNREITAVTPLSVRTTIPYARADRPGLCGSAVVNEEHELVGIHTGSTYSDEGAQFDVGYATNASFLNTLVEAYHNEGKATFPLIFNKQKIVDLNVDEYISYVALYDADGKVLWQKGFESKFSYSTVQKKIEELSPRSMTVTTRRATWDQAEPTVLFENHTAAWDTSKVTYKYDFKIQQIVSVKKAKRR